MHSNTIRTRLTDLDLRLATSTGQTTDPSGLKACMNICCPVSLYDRQSCVMASSRPSRRRNAARHTLTDIINETSRLLEDHRMAAQPTESRNLDGSYNRNEQEIFEDLAQFAERSMFFLRPARMEAKGRAFEKSMRQKQPPKKRKSELWRQTTKRFTRP